MCIVCFGYKDLKSFLINVGCFYLVSILLGGFLYFINDSLSFKNNGIVFFNNGFSLNILFLIVVSPVALFLYIKQMKMFKKRINFTFKTNIYIGKKVLNLNGYLDSGNVLKYKNKPVILCNTHKSPAFFSSCIYISSIMRLLLIPMFELLHSGVFIALNSALQILPGKHFSDRKIIH